MIRKKLLKKAACLMAVAAVTVTGFGTVAYGYGEYQAGSTASQTDGSNEFLTWRDSVWRTAGNYDDSAKVALTPGKTEKDLNFAWYSENTSKPAVMVWKNGARSQAKVFEGTGSTVDADNWQGKNYQTSNKVSVEGYFEDNIQIIITDNRLYGQQLIRTRPAIHRNIRLYLQETHRLVLQVQVMINQQQILL